MAPTMSPLPRLILLRQMHLLNVLMLIILRRRRAIKDGRGGRRKCWVRHLWRRRNQEGAYHSLVSSMRLHDSSMFFRFLRMSPSRFDHLLGLIQDKIKKHPRGRPALSPGHRLTMTLRFLAAGESFTTLGFSFRTGFTTAKRIVYETCEALWDVLQPLYLPSPTKNTWETVARQFEEKWNFPHCLGAVDGKHILIQAPPDSGTMFFNYKGTFSIVLLAIADANYKFIVVDIGGYGSHSDGGLFKSSAFGKALQDGTLDLPPPSCLPNSQITAPYVLIRDEAFQLREDFLRPFPGNALNDMRRIFNYRLSRARRCVENAFGILTAKWRIFRQPLPLKPDNAEKIVKACIVLHNYLRTEEALSETEEVYCPQGFGDHTDLYGNLFEGQWRDFLRANPGSALGDVEARAAHARNYSQRANDVRLAFANYFISKEGEVPWQWKLPGLSQTNSGASMPAN